MKRWKLELRRLRGALAFHWVMLMPVKLDRLWWPLLGWAGLYAYFDCDRANWELLATSRSQHEGAE